LPLWLIPTKTWFVPGSSRWMAVPDALSGFGCWRGLGPCGSALIQALRAAEERARGLAIGSQSDREALRRLVPHDRVVFVAGGHHGLMP
jgi:hypothetical protein